MRDRSRWEPLVAVALAVVFLLDHLEVYQLPGPVGLLICALILGLGVLRHRARTTPPILPSAASAAIFAALTLSVFWSDVPDYTGERLRTYAPALVAAWVMGVSLTRQEMLRTFRWFARISVASYVVMIAAFPWARETGPDGPAGWHANLSKNGLGLMLALLVAVVLAFEAGWVRILEIAALLVMSAGNESRTSQLCILVMLFAFVAWAWLDASREPLQRRARALILASVAILGGLLVIYGRDVVLAAVDKDPTLTSRTIIWQGAADQIAKAPWLGHGAFAFLEPAAHSPSQQAVARYFNAFVPPHAHNGVLDLVGQIGVVGLVAYVLAAVAAGLAVRSAHDRYLSRFGVFGGVLLLLAAPVEPMFLGGWLIVLLLVDGSARHLIAFKSQNRRPRIHAPQAERRIERACST